MGIIRIAPGADLGFGCRTGLWAMAYLPGCSCPQGTWAEANEGRAKRDHDEQCTDVGRRYGPTVEGRAFASKRAQACKYPTVGRSMSSGPTVPIALNEMGRQGALRWQPLRSSVPGGDSGRTCRRATTYIGTWGLFRRRPLYGLVGTPVGGGPGRGGTIRAPNTAVATLAGGGLTCTARRNLREADCIRLRRRRSDSHRSRSELRSPRFGGSLL